jgi:hypothetical protein
MLFRKVALFVIDDVKLQNIITTSTMTKSSKDSAKDGLRATMSSINDALQRVDEFRANIWTKLNLPLEMPMAALTGNLLYGDISSTIHLPGFKSVYISSSESKEYIQFFETVVKIVSPSSKVIIYADGKAARGDEIFGPS